VESKENCYDEEGMHIRNDLNNDMQILHVRFTKVSSMNIEGD
jgi:hypothetical protein